MGITKENLKNILSGFYDKIKPDLHHHDNKDILDLLNKSEDGNLLFDEKEIKSTIEDLEKYETKEDLKTLLNDYAKTDDIHTHNNKDILDLLTRSEKGNLLFDGEEIKSDDLNISSYITDDEISNSKLWSSDRISKYVNEVISNDDIAGNNFISENGYRGLRYHEGKLEYYNNETEKWVDLVFTGDNQYIIQMVPQSMQFVNAENDPDNSRIKLYFTPPENTIINDQVCCIVDGVRIVRKTGSTPTSHEDGELIVDIKSYEFNNYINSFYVDSNVELGNTYYYGFYPYSDLGFYNESSTNVIPVLCKDYILYGFYVNSNESDPSKAVTYLEDNKKFNPAYMNYSSNTFDYGSWKNAFFMPRPCMLKYDGTVDYYLDPNDYTKKENGEDSDVADESYEGNAMIEWGQNGKIIYYKIVPDEDPTSYSVYISDINVDGEYKYWSFINNYGDVVDHFYTPIYNGYKDDNDRLRSISGKTPTGGTTRQQEVQYALENNLENQITWYTEVFCDITLINFLLVIMAKSLDTQTKYGQGRSASSNSSAIATGTMNTKGLFWGSTNGTDGVKVFGMENWWGNVWRAVAGYMNVSYTQKYKMTYGTQDGSTASAYNFDGSGYKTGAYLSSGGYISKQTANHDGIFPSTTSGSSSTYYVDYVWEASITCYAYHSGRWGDGAWCGAFYWALSDSTSSTRSDITAAISCKPIKKEE